MASVKKIKFRVSASFFALTFLMLVIRMSYTFAMYMIALVLHEFAHAAVARIKGFKTNEIVLSAFGAVLYGEFDTASPKDEIQIALAGPASNICFAALTAAVWWFFPPAYVFMEDFFFCNIAICMVNLLPSYPLDGGRALLALLKQKFSPKKSEKILQVTGIILSFAVFALFIFTCFNNINLTFGLFSVFLFINATSIIRQNAWNRVAVTVNLKKKLKKGMEVKRFVISQNAAVRQLVKLKSHRHLSEIALVDDSYRTVRVIPFTEVDEIILKCDLDAELKNI